MTKNQLIIIGFKRKRESVFQNDETVGNVSSI